MKENNKSNKIDLKDLNNLAFSMLENTSKANTEKKKKKREKNISKIELPKLNKSKKIDTNINNNYSLQAKPMDVDYIDPTEVIPIITKDDTLEEQIEVEEIKEEPIIIDDDEKQKELLKDYVGANNKKIINRFYNVSAFLFGAAYYLYRKLYITGAIILLLDLSILYFINNLKYIILLKAILMIIMGLTFNKYYLMISKKRINHIQSKEEENTIKEKCVLQGGTDLLVSILITVGYFIILVLFFSTSIFKISSNFVNLDKVFQVTKEDEMGYDATNFGNMVEAYAANAKLNIEYPGIYKYMIEDEEYDFIALPVANDEKNIYCLKKTKDGSWEEKKGFNVKDNSTTCDEFMTDIINNYSKFYKLKLPETGELILSKDGKIQKKSYLKYKNTTCNYNSKERLFECKK